MLQTASRHVAIQSLKGKLLTAYEYLIANVDQENAGKVKQLAGKLVDEEFTIAFCGHFSAGKSTIINRLIGENLLPSSPIPTSANLVKVKAGDEYAKVFFKNEKPRLYLAPYDYKMVKNYCKDGDQIQVIEISHSGFRLPRQTVIMDTPGIDSVDEAHRIATESAIHLADLIFYVMDYNHVQSELNFMFTKELAVAGKEIYLVINQVDKHSEEELSFASFKTSVVEAFTTWGVKPAAIFYTSLKYEDHAYNDFPRLQAFLTERLAEKDTLLLQSIEQALHKIMKDHLALKRKQDEQALQSSRDILQVLTAQEQAELAGTYQRLQEEKEALGEGLEKAASEFDHEVSKIITNAYLMPFQTRALAESYLEACQSGFKVGWLFSKQKTAEARQERLNLFYQEILEKTKSQLEWHLRDFLLRFSREKRVEDRELHARIQSFAVHFSDELLSAALKPGARLSGDYVIHYTDQVATEIKLLANRVLAEVKQAILRALQGRNTVIQAGLLQQSAGLERYIAAMEQIKMYEAGWNLEQNKVQRMLNEAPDQEVDRFGLFKSDEKEFEIVSGDTGQEKEVLSTSFRPLQTPVIPEKGPLSAGSGDRMKHIAKKLEDTAQLVEELPGFRKLAGELEEKAARLRQRGFTVALFGAFSAGKSSFANALIGEKVLPVSPNPMTAAINKIRPVDDSCPHGTVLVKLKEEGALREEVNRALKLFALHAGSLADAQIKIETLTGQLEQLSAVEKTNYAFLQAFGRGYSRVSGQLGTVLTTTLAEFGDYVAVEEKSCFVEWIELYYDCPLTRKGITLVDTPGADSINARHTGVSFEFIKNSDAILFVTYYNHAFSKADREFLMQLGRVKDSFQLDKMFFIINAIDLANDEEEKETVENYVQKQLIQYGVRNPHLYSLSSLEALKEKRESSTLPVSGMPFFEEAFYHFITHDLANLAVAASENELKRVSCLVEKLIDRTREAAAVKQQRQAGIQAEKAVLCARIRQQTVQHLKNRLAQETKELLYYIKQRVFFRFSTFFREAFNPSVLRDDGRDLKKALHHALDELLEQTGFEFAQEMRATTVRLDRFAEKIMVEYQAALVEAIREINSDLSFSLFEFKSTVEIDFKAAFREMPYGQFAKAMAYFKNPKAFFEKNESKLMSEELYRVLQPAAGEYLQAEQKRIQALYEQVMETEFERLILAMTEQAEDFYLSLLSALEGGVPAERLIEIRQRLI